MKWLDIDTKTRKSSNPEDSWNDTYISIEEQQRLVSILLEAAAQLEWFLRKEMLKNENPNS